MRQLRPNTETLKRVRLPASGSRRGLPLTLAAFAVIAAASTAATTVGAGASTVDSAPAGATVLPPAVPPTYSYPGTVSGETTAPPTDGTSSTAGPAAGTPSGEAAPALAASGIPERAVQAYKAAAAAQSSCGIPWTLIAAIGRVESNHGRFGGATLLADGRSDPPIVGIPLDGRPGVAEIGDTDGGKYDGDTTHDRAVGPMQFIPGTWKLFATDGDHDGKADPFDIDDAAAAAATYLCRAGGDLSTEAGQRDAVYSYNRSDSYVSLVMALSAQYAGGAPVDTAPAPSGSPRPLPPITQPHLPPGTVGTPPAATPTPTPTKPKPKPTKPAPTTTKPSPTTSAPGSPSGSPTSPSTGPTSPSTSPTSPTPSPTCTQAPTDSPSPSGSISPEGVTSAAAADGTTVVSASASNSSATAAESTSAAAAETPTPTASPTLPTCPTP